MRHVVTVFAAYGRQGTAAVRALLDAGSHVRAVVHDIGSTGARLLADIGAEVVLGSLDDPQAIARALKGANSLFFYQPIYISPQATPGIGPDDELRRGRAVFDAAARAGIGHVLYSSALGADRSDVSALLRPKAQLEDYLRSSGLPATILRPVGFMENYLGPARGLRADGTLVSAMPPDVVEQLISVRDIASFAALVFADCATWIGRELDIVADELTTPDIAAAIAKSTGRNVHYEQVPLDTIRAQDPKRAMALERIFRSDRPVADLRQCRAINFHLMDFKSWLVTEEVTRAMTAYLTDIA